MPQITDYSEDYDNGKKIYKLSKFWDSDDIPSPLYDLLSVMCNSSHSRIKHITNIKDVYFIIDPKKGHYCITLSTYPDPSIENFTKGMWTVMPTIGNKIICMSIFNPFLRYSREYASYCESTWHTKHDVEEGGIKTTINEMASVLTGIENDNTDFTIIQTQSQDNKEYTVLFYTNTRKIDYTLELITVIFSLEDALKHASSYDCLTLYNTTGLITEYFRNSENEICHTSKEINVPIIEFKF